MKNAGNTMLPSQSDRREVEATVDGAICRARDAVESLLANTEVRQDIMTVAQLMDIRMKEGRKILICGNGGSAMDAQHWVAELVGRYKKERAGLPAIALTADQAILTAVANDYNYGNVFERQVAALGQPGDIVIGITTSGCSPNVLRALEYAWEHDMTTVMLTGLNAPKVQMYDFTLRVPANETARVQELHQIVYHSICEVIDALCD